MSRDCARVPLVLDTPHPFLWRQLKRYMPLVPMPVAIGYSVALSLGYMDVSVRLYAALQ